MADSTPPAGKTSNPAAYDVIDPGLSPQENLQNGLNLITNVLHGACQPFDGIFKLEVGRRSYSLMHYGMGFIAAALFAYVDGPGQANLPIQCYFWVSLLGAVSQSYSRAKVRRAGGYEARYYIGHYRWEPWGRGKACLLLIMAALVAVASEQSHLAAYLLFAAIALPIRDALIAEQDRERIQSMVDAQALAGRVNPVQSFSQLPSDKPRGYAVPAPVQAVPQSPQGDPALQSFLEKYRGREQ